MCTLSMSGKRSATTELNHENWDQDDPSEHEEAGSFKPASKDVLEKRVIRTAKRRSNITSEEGKKGVFTGFGFNKTQPTSFDFLANLTNGNKTNTLAPTSKSDSAVTSTLFSNKALSGSPTGNLFGKLTTASPTNTTFGNPTQTSSLFGVSSTSTTTVTSIFTASKADSTVGDSPFKTQPITSTSEVKSKDITQTTSANISGSQVTSSLFGVSSTNTNKSLFSSTNNTYPFKIQPVSSSTTMQSSFGTSSNTSTVSKASLTDSKSSSDDDRKLKYYAKLKGLNESVSEWIKQHVDETPLCILTPIFKDYEIYLKEMQDECEGTEKEKSIKSNIPSTAKVEAKTLKDLLFTNNTTTSTPKFESPKSKPSVFGIQTSTPTPVKKSNFSFGIKPSATVSPGAGFSFGISTSQSTSTSSSLFSTTSKLNSNGETPFSFGSDKPFSFSTNVQSPPAETKENGNEEEEDQPPKVEFTPIEEDNSIYDKKCKIFVKKDGAFVDKGVGTLYIKKVADSEKHQLLIRANTNLGNILVNLILGAAVPTQRMGKNNVMMVCIPTPDSKPPPTTILIRVKSSDEADELLDTLNKYKN